MSKHEQCPSTNGKKPVRRARQPMPRSGATGRAYWRGLDELADTPEFRERLEREFPAFASELSGESRRTFLKLMGASLALAGVGAMPGCRRPDHKILAYNEMPEDVIPGKALFYASVLPRVGGGGAGVLVETHEGRPTKIEGNPLHPIVRGKSDAAHQAVILDLYDPLRLEPSTRLVNGERRPTTWSEFDNFAGPHFEQFDQSGGRGLVFLVEKHSSPSLDAMRERIRSRWPRAKWLPYSPIDDEAGLEATRSLFGRPMRERLSLESASIVLSIDHDFLSTTESRATLADVRGFTAGRRVIEPTDEMNRLYAVESMMTLTGGMADHRARVKPSMVGPFLAAIASRVVERAGDGMNGLRSAISGVAGAAGDAPVDPAFIDAVVEDLLANRGRSVVLVGDAQPASVRALGMALNEALGAVGPIVRYVPLEGDAAASSLESIRTLSSDIDAGSVSTLVVVGANPVYDAPADLDIAGKFEGVPTTITLAHVENETGARSSWRLQRAHWLETWFDVRAEDGTLSVGQPMIRPLAYETAGDEGGRGDLETLARLLGDETTDPYEIVRRTWRSGPLAGGDFEKKWRRVLHDGLLAGSERRGLTPSVNASRAAQMSGRIQPPSDAFECVIKPCPKVMDGRFANNGWMQENPHPVTKMAWDNPLLLSPKQAEEMNLTDGDMVRVTIDGRSVEMAVFRVPGLADQTCALELGYGRTHSGPVGEGVGFDVYPLRASGAMSIARDVTIEKIAGSYPLACAQTHWSMEGRPMIVEADVPALRAHHEPLHMEDSYGREKTLRFAERFTTLAHTPANVDIYDGVLQEQTHTYEERPQWGMTIDLNTCNGCGACTIACQSENNIPVVGKQEVAKGREMHWIRIDRYFARADVEEGESREREPRFGTAGPYTGGRVEGDVDMLVQPVACVHCENAPCETVCPVNATVHDEAGLNVMAYNRCIGTRYCSNNCPYKVRRFNYFDYATKRFFGGDYVGKDVIGGLVTNKHFVPPRLRQRMEEGSGELKILQYNPNVTVRERGVMEKCTYCIQRIHEARLETKLQGMDHIPDGFFQVACQQACPADAIVFGDILDPLSKVRALQDNPRGYGLLGYLATKPRTHHLARLRNPHPAIRRPTVDPFHHGAHEEDDAGDAGGEAHSRVGGAGGLFFEHAREGEGRRLSLRVLSEGARAAARTSIGGRA